MACAKLGVLRELVAAIETIAGTAEVLSPGTDSRFRVWDPKFEPDVTLFDRKFARNTLSPHSMLPTTKVGKITFSLEVRRSESGDTPDLWASTFLPACGFLQTIDSGNQVDYTPSSDCNDHHTLTMAVNIDGNLHQIHGAMGNVTFRGQVGEPMFMDFEFMGKYDEDDSSDVALSSSISHESGIPDPFQGIALEYDTSGPDLVISSVNINPNMNVIMEEDASEPTGYKRALVTAREGEFTFNPERIPLATYDFWSQLTDGDQVAASFYSGASLNVKFTMPALQISGPVGEEDRNGVAALSIPFKLCSDDENGDDELTITLS